MQQVSHFCRQHKLPGTERNTAPSDLAGEADLTATCVTAESLKSPMFRYWAGKKLWLTTTNRKKLFQSAHYGSNHLEVVFLKYFYGFTVTSANYFAGRAKAHLFNHCFWPKYLDHRMNSEIKQEVGLWVKQENQMISHLPLRPHRFSQIRQPYLHRQNNLKHGIQ